MKVPPRASGTSCVLPLAPTGRAVKWRGLLYSGVST